MQLPEAFRRCPRPSSALDAKASTACLCSFFFCPPSSQTQSLPSCLARVMHKVAFMPNSCARTTSPSCLNPAPLITTPPSLGETMGCSGSRCLVERFLSPGTRRVVTSLVKVQNPPQGVPETDPYEIGQLSLPLTSRSRVYAAHFTLCKGWSRLFSMNLWWRFCGVLRSHSPSISALRPYERGHESVVEMRGVDPRPVSASLRIS